VVIGKGAIYEGVACYLIGLANGPGIQEFYRLIAPPPANAPENALGSHLYTASQAERDAVLRSGVVPEGSVGLILSQGPANVLGLGPTVPLFRLRRVP
jgi:hypothetical protein